MEATPILILKGLPLPPTSNHMYINLPRGGRAPSKHLKAFEKSFKKWEAKARIVYGAQVREFRKHPLRPMTVHVIYYFPHEKIWTQDGRPQKLDTENRAKALMDSLAKFIGIDDKWTFHIGQTKAVSATPQAVVEFRFIEGTRATADPVRESRGALGPSPGLDQQ